jgi:hypothetical protein
MKGNSGFCYILQQRFAVACHICSHLLVDLRPCKVRGRKDRADRLVRDDWR